MTTTVNITTNPLFEGADYSASRWPILSLLEGVKPQVYIDSKGYATIGVGFLISANADLILQGMAPNLSQDLGISVPTYDALVAAIQNVV